MLFRIAAFRSRFEPRCFDFAHTAILLLPLSTACEAGVLKGRERRDVMSMRRRRRFLREPLSSASKTERWRLRREDGWSVGGGTGGKTRGVRRGTGREEKVKAVVDGLKRTMVSRGGEEVVVVRL